MTTMTWNVKMKDKFVFLKQYMDEWYHLIENILSQRDSEKINNNFMY